MNPVSETKYHVFWVIFWVSDYMQVKRVVLF